MPMFEAGVFVIQNPVMLNPTFTVTPAGNAVDEVYPQCSQSFQSEHYNKTQGMEGY